MFPAQAEWSGQRSVVGMHQRASARPWSPGWAGRLAGEPGFVRRRSRALGVYREAVVLLGERRELCLELKSREKGQCVGSFSIVKTKQHGQGNL